MPPICRDRCRHDKQGYNGPGLYAQGYKRCSLCSKFILTKELHCHCCGMMLRAQARSRKYKEKMRVIARI